MPFDGPNYNGVQNAERSTKPSHEIFNEAGADYSSVLRTAENRARNKTRKTKNKQVGLAPSPESRRPLRKAIKKVSKSIINKSKAPRKNQLIKALFVTARIWLLGPFWLYIFVQLPFAVLGLFAIGGAAAIDALPILISSLASSVVPTEIFLGIGSTISILVGWSTLAFAMAFYSFKKIPCFSSLGHYISFVAAAGLYVSPGTNLFPCAMLWMGMVIYTAGQNE